MALEYTPATWDPAYNSISSLRRDPRRNSTTTIAYKPRLDAHGRPVSESKAFHFGPGFCIVGGEQRYTYLDRGQDNTKMAKTADFAEILQHFKQGTAKAQASSSRGQDAGQQQQQQQHHHHHHSSSNRETASPRDTHLVQHSASQRLTHGYGSVGSFGGAYGTARQGQPFLTQSMRDSYLTYAEHKMIGHKEYEATCKKVDGLNSWVKTGGVATSSMEIGKPSRMLSPYEHTTTKLTTLRHSSMPYA